MPRPLAVHPVAAPHVVEYRLHPRGWLGAFGLRRLDEAQAPADVRAPDDVGLIFVAHSGPLPSAPAAPVVAAAALLLLGLPALLAPRRRVTALLAEEPLLLGREGELAPAVGARHSLLA